MTDERITTKLAQFASAFVRRSLPFVCIALLCFGLFAISEWSIDPRLRAKNAKFESQLARIQARVSILKGTAESLKAEVDRLHSDPNEIMYHSRNSLGMVRPGEIIYRFEARAESHQDGDR